jgi:hypothetical protein
MLVSSTSAFRMFSFALVVMLAFGCGGGTAHAVHSFHVHGQEHDLVTAAEYAQVEGVFIGEESSGGVEFVGYTDTQCQDLLDKKELVGVFNGGIAVLTGTGGLVTIIPNNATDEKKDDIQLGVGITTVCLASANAMLTMYTGVLNRKYERQCMTADPEPVEHPASDEVAPTELELAPLPDELDIPERDGGV